MVGEPPPHTGGYSFIYYAIDGSEKSGDKTSVVPSTSLRTGGDRRYRLHRRSAVDGCHEELNVCSIIKR
jgi:hypothetical protein